MVFGPASAWRSKEGSLAKRTCEPLDPVGVNFTPALLHSQCKLVPWLRNSSALALMVDKSTRSSLRNLTSPVTSRGARSMIDVIAFRHLSSDLPVKYTLAFLVYKILQTS